MNIADFILGTYSNHKYLHIGFKEPDTGESGPRKGIANLEVKLSGGNITHTLRTKTDGILPLAKFSKDATVCKVSVILPNKKETKLEDIPLANAFTAHTYVSTYIVAKGVTEVNAGEGDPIAKINALKECYELENDKTNLRLGSNVIHRKWIIAASERSNIPALAIAGLISCESGSVTLEAKVKVDANKFTQAELAKTEKIKQEQEAQVAKVDAESLKAAEDKVEASKGTKAANISKRELSQLKKNIADKSGAKIKKALADKISEAKRMEGSIINLTYSIWNKDAKALTTTASGLTQFLKGTWKEVGLNKGTYLHDAAVNKVKCIVLQPTKVTKKQVTPLTDAQKQQNEQSIKNSQTTKKKAMLIKEKVEFIDVPGPGKFVIEDEKAFYNMRFIPEYSIMAAVDYAIMCRAPLLEDFPKIKEVKNPGNQAKILYMGHHLGPEGCVNFVRNKFTDEHAKYLLLQQLGGDEERANRLANVKKEKSEEFLNPIGDGKWVWTHRRWLVNFIDPKIVLSDFACNKDVVPMSDSVYDIILDMGGSHPKGFDIPKKQNR